MFINLGKVRQQPLKKKLYGAPYLLDNEYGGEMEIDRNELDERKWLGFWNKEHKISHFKFTTTNSEENIFIRKFVIGLQRATGSGKKLKIIRKKGGISLHCPNLHERIEKEREKRRE